MFSWLHLCVQQPAMYVFNPWNNTLDTIQETLIVFRYLFFLFYHYSRSYAFNEVNSQTHIIWRIKTIDFNFVDWMHAETMNNIKEKQCMKAKNTEKRIVDWALQFSIRFSSILCWSGLLFQMKRKEIVHISFFTIRWDYNILCIVFSFFFLSSFTENG